MKNQKGITLIALVITIIVLLILAGVSIAMLTGENGILTRANDAKTQNEYAAIKDKVQLAIQAVYADTIKPNPTVSAVTPSAIATQYETDNTGETATGDNDNNTLSITTASGTYTVKLQTTTSGSSMDVQTISK